MICCFQNISFFKDFYLKFSTWEKETIIDGLQSEVVTMSLLPNDCGFCPKALRAEVKIPNVDAIRVSYINKAGIPALFLGNAERCIKVLRSSGYNVFYEDQDYVQSK